MPSFTDEASDSDGGAKKVRTTGEPKHFIRLIENRSWKLMWTRSHVRKRVRTLAGSGRSCTIFTDRNLFTDYQPYQSPISTAGGTIKSTGRGTVGKLQNCLYVPEMNINLISTVQVLKQYRTYALYLKMGCLSFKTRQVAMQTSSMRTFKTYVRSLTSSGWALTTIARTLLRTWRTAMSK